MPKCIFHSRISIIRFIVPIQSDKVVYAKIYRRSFVSFPRKSYQFVFVYWRARAHFVHSRIFPKRFRHVAKSTDVVVIIVIGAYAERRSRATGIPLYQASFILGKQYICCTIFSINLLNVPKKDRAFIFVYSSQIDSSILYDIYINIVKTFIFVVDFKYSAYTQYY